MGQGKVEYKVGYNFDSRLIGAIRRLNALSDFAKIKSVYASSSEFDWLTARPKYRLPEVSLREIESHIKQLHTENIKFYYALNAPYIGSKASLAEKESDIIDFVRRLEDAAVDGVIVTHPLLAEIVKKNSEMEITLSSIANIFSANQIETYRQLYGVHSFCLSPYFNREIGRLIRIQKNISANNCDLELIVNELCGLGFLYGEGMSPCIFRESCFICHSENATCNEEDLMGGYPQNICMVNRNGCKSSFWCKLRFIRPEDIPRYAGVGICKFKITGRTASTEDILRVLKAYMTFDFDGDVSSLWYMKGAAKTIGNKELDGMADFWFSEASHSCDDEICGVTCRYCDNFLQNRIAP